jgi:hypothetical protein
MSAWATFWRTVTFGPMMSAAAAVERRLRFAGSRLAHRLVAGLMLVALLLFGLYHVGMAAAGTQAEHCRTVADVAAAEHQVAGHTAWSDGLHGRANPAKQMHDKCRSQLGGPGFLPGVVGRADPKAHDGVAPVHAAIGEGLLPAAAIPPPRATPSA